MRKTLIAATTMAAALWAASPSYAACPNFQFVTGTNASETLSGALQRATSFKGLGGVDRFNVEEPRLHSSTGCTSRDWWDRIVDYRSGEVISVPGTVASYFVSGCNVYWKKTGSSATFFAGIPCGLSKSAITIR
jgi:hypothetical protein